MSIADFRREYVQTGLHEGDMDRDPIVQFERWFQQALDAGVEDVNAMFLATANAEGRPSGRIVLLKGFDERGFVFYTNYGSRKARDLEANPQVELVSWWPALDRQVRIGGRAERVSDDEADQYFATRPRGAQIGAWASAQSEVLSDRAALERAAREVADRFADTDPLPRPPFWGGYRVIPDVMEFWQGRPNRLHDRLRYRRTDGAWTLERLAP